MTSASDHVAVVTGGTGGLGAPVVTALARSGHTVLVPWIDQAETDRLSAALGELRDRVRLRQADLRSDDGARAFFDWARGEAGPADALVGLAGGFAFGAFAETDAATWSRMYELNVATVVNCARCVVPGMVERGWGRIVTVAAVPAVSGAGANMTAYSAAKAAVLTFTTSLAGELAGTGVTANALVPTILDTEANRAAMPDADRSHWLPPDRIAPVIEWLISDAAGLVTGTAVRLSLG